MKSVMESIEKKLKGQKTFSAMEHSNVPAWNVLKELYDGGHESIDFNGVRYVLSFHPSTTDHLSHRSTTPEFQVKRQTTKSIFDVDQVLAHKEIEVRDWMGGDPAKKCGLVSNKLPLESMKDITSVVMVILTNTKYNVMVQRHDTGDATIWVDDKRFTQR